MTDPLNSKFTVTLLLLTVLCGLVLVVNLFLTMFVYVKLKFNDKVIFLLMLFLDLALITRIAFLLVVELETEDYYITNIGECSMDILASTSFWCFMMATLSNGAKWLQFYIHGKTVLNGNIQQLKNYNKNYRIALFSSFVVFTLPIVTIICISCSSESGTNTDQFNSGFNIFFFCAMAIAFSLLGYLILSILNKIDDDLY